jgi:prevent-host-death family protein
LTYYGLVKTINISTFKARISEQLKLVRKGERIVITERDTPIAEVLPYEKKPDLVLRSPRGNLKFPRLSFQVARDPIDFLMEERKKR